MYYFSGKTQDEVKSLFSRSGLFRLSVLDCAMRTMANDVRIQDYGELQVDTANVVRAAQDLVRTVLNNADWLMPVGDDGTTVANGENVREMWLAEHLIRASDLLDAKERKGD